MTLLSSSEPPGNMEVGLAQHISLSASLMTSQIKVLRRQGGNRLSAFAPVHDLSIISRSSDISDGRLSRTRDRQMGGLDAQGGKVLGDEWAEHVVLNRSGIMLRASTLLVRDVRDGVLSLLITEI